MSSPLLYVLFFSCQTDQTAPPLVAPTAPHSFPKKTEEPQQDSEPNIPLIVVSGRTHPSCDGMALLDVLPLDGIDPEPLMTETVASDGSFSIEIPKLTPVALHCSCYANVQDIETDQPNWRVQPLSIKPLDEPVQNLVLFKEGLRPDHAPVEGVTLEEAIEITQIRQAASLPEIIGPSPPEEQDKTVVIKTEFFEQGPPVPEEDVIIDPSDFEPIRVDPIDLPTSEAPQSDFWTLFYDIEPDENTNTDKGREGDRRPIGTAAASHTGWVRTSDLQRYFDSVTHMVSSYANQKGINPTLLLPDAALIKSTAAKGSLYTQEAQLVTQQLSKACHILRIHCPPPSIILRQRFVLNDKRSVGSSDDGAALSAYLWVRAEQLIREAQRQGVDPRPYLPKADELVAAADQNPQSEAVQAILRQLQSGYNALNIPFYSID